MQTPLPGPARAILLMLAAIFCFSVMDSLVKSVSKDVGVGPALWARYGGQMLIVFLLVSPRLKSVAHTQHLGLQIARSVLLLCATAFLFTGLSLIGLAEATAVMVMNPIFISIGGVLFLGERLGLRRVVAIALAFCGAMLIIRPGTDTFNAAALFPLLAAISYSGYALITRHVGPSEDPWTSLFYTALVGGILTSLALPFVWQPPSGFSIFLMTALACVGTLGQLMLIRAFSMAEASVLAPFGYSGVVFATLIGLIFFLEVPSWTTLTGALVIVGSGIYVWLRETQQKSTRS